MHPLVSQVILPLIGLVAVLGGYVVYHVHSLHATTQARYMAKMVPFAIAAIWLIWIALRLFRVLP